MAWWQIGDKPLPGPVLTMFTALINSMVSCQKGPTRHAYEWQIGAFWQDTLVYSVVCVM